MCPGFVGEYFADAPSHRSKYEVYQDVSTRRVRFQSQAHIRIRFESPLHHLFGFPRGESLYQVLEGSCPATVVFHRSTWFKIRPELASVLPDNVATGSQRCRYHHVCSSHEHKDRRFPTR